MKIVRKLNIVFEFKFRSERKGRERKERERKEVETISFIS